MNTNTLENFRGIFSQDTQKYLKSLSLVTPYLAERDVEIAKYLGFQTPEIFWLVRKLNFEYDKLFPDKIKLPPNFIEQLARSSAFTIHETGTEDFSVNNTINLINNTINNIIDNDDIISIADSISLDMDTLDEDDMDSSGDKFHNKLPLPETSSLANSSPRPSTAAKTNASHKQQSRKQKIIYKNDASVINNNLNAYPINNINNTSHNINNNNASFKSTVVQDTRDSSLADESHMTSLPKETAVDSQHNYHRNGLNNSKPYLHSQDLRHHINKSKISRTPPTKFIKASVMVMLAPGDTRYEKLEPMNSLLATLPGFVDLDWKFLNGNAHIVFHFNNRKLLLKALEQYPHSHFNIIDDHPTKNFESSTPIYKLKEVPYLINLDDIKRAITYYGNIISLEEKHNYRNPSNRDVIITFFKVRKPQQLKEA